MSSLSDNQYNELEYDLLVLAIASWMGDSSPKSLVRYEKYASTHLPDTVIAISNDAFVASCKFQHDLKPIVGYNYNLYIGESGKKYIITRKPKYSDCICAIL